MPYSALLLLLSASLLALASVYWLIRYRRWDWFALGTILAFVAIFFQIHFVAPIVNSDDPNIVAMGSNHQPAAPAESLMPFCLLFGAMALGMMAQSGYERFVQPQKTRPPFDLGVFLAPLFISPIIFIPLYESIDEQRVVGKSLFLVCLVAFENGFFFKNYLDGRNLIRAQEQNKNDT